MAPNVGAPTFRSTLRPCFTLTIDFLVRGGMCCNETMRVAIGVRWYRKLVSINRRLLNQIWKGAPLVKIKDSTVTLKNWGRGYVPLVFIPHDAYGPMGVAII